MNKKQFNVAMVATEAESHLVKASLTDKPYFIDPANKVNGAQHLYFTSDEEIKEGNWFILNNIIYKCKGLHEIHDVKDRCKKIIATTDKELKSKIKDEHCIRIKSLPQIPQSFIKAYANNPTDTVWLEHWTLDEWKIINIGVPYSSFEETNGLKLNDKGEVIVVEDENKTHSKGDIFKLFEEYCKHCHAKGKYFSLSDAQEWLKEQNL